MPKWPSPIWWGLALVSLTYYLGGGINKDIVTPIRNEAAQARYEKALLAEKRREENKAYWAESKELGGEIMGKIIFPLMLAILASFLLCNALNVIDFIG